MNACIPQSFLFLSSLSLSRFFRSQCRFVHLIYLFWQKTRIENQNIEISQSSAIPLNSTRAQYKCILSQISRQFRFKLIPSIFAYAGRLIRISRTPRLPLMIYSITVTRAVTDQVVLYTSQIVT